MPSRKNLQKNSGFTLIELLVVISIIALLSVIVIGSLGEGRDKANNSAKNQLIQEYQKALELYRNNNTSGNYPSGSSPTNNICLGDYGDDKCMYFYDTDPTFVTKIEQYIPSAPRDNLEIKISTYDFSGIIYSCKTSACNDYIIEWYLKGSNQNCTSDIDGVNDGDLTRCEYDSSVELRDN